MKNTAPDKPPCLCDVCGVDMRDPETGATTIGININITKPQEDDGVFGSTGNPKELDRVLNVFGKAYFNICFVCVLKAFGVKKND